MKHLDLFSGIGGFALATEMVWDDVEHVFCDNEPYSQAIIKKHWPNSQIHGDIRQVTADTIGCGHLHRESEIDSAEGGKQAQSKSPASCGRFSVDLLTGGFPCQPFSQAGRRKGKADDRYLWPEMLRVIKELKPRWIIGENVAGLLTMVEQQSNADMEDEADIEDGDNGDTDAGGIIWDIINDIEQAGYSVQTFVIPAVSLNAPHRRDRIWIVAHSGQQHGRQGGNEGVEEDTEERTPRSTDTERQDKDGGDAPNTERKRQQGQRKYQRPLDSEEDTDRETDTTTSHSPSWDENWLEVATKLCRVDDGLSAALDGFKLSKSQHRKARLKGLGNAIVPQVAAEIMKAIKRIDTIHTHSSLPHQKYGRMNGI